MKTASVIHLMMSTALGAAVPAVAFLINGDVATEIFVLGTVIGFAYWYWGPTGPPL